MMKKILYRLETTILGGAIIVGAASVLSRLVGLIRDRLLASTFGAGEVLDVYYAAFRLPDFIFNIFVLGALSASFIPVFLEYWHRDQSKSEAERQAWPMTNSILNLIAVTLIILGGLMWLFTPQLMGIIVSIVFFGVSNVLSGILNSFRRFFVYSLAPIMYNLGIIFGILVLAPHWGVKGLAYGVVIGSFAHLVVQWPAARRVGFAYQWVFNTAHTGVRRIGRLMIPRALSLGVVQINQVVINVLASNLGTGSVAVFNLANNLQSFPIGVFGISLAISSFPVFSKAWAEIDRDGFVRHFSESFRRILFLIIPVSVGILLLRAQFVRIILGAGAFDWTDTILTAQTLGFFSLSLFAQSLAPMLTRSFYAFQNTKTPVIISLISMAMNIGLGIWLSQRWGIYGLALAFSISSVVNTLLLLIALRVVVGDLDERRILRSTIKIIAATIIMGAIVQLMKYFIATGVNMQTFLGVALQTSIAFVAGVIAYIIIAYLLHCEEIGALRQWLDKAKQLFQRNGQTTNYE